MTTCFVQLISVRNACNLHSTRFDLNVWCKLDTYFSTAAVFARKLIAQLWVPVKDVISPPPLYKLTVTGQWDKPRHSVQEMTADCLVEEVLNCSLFTPSIRWLDHSFSHWVSGGCWEMSTLLYAFCPRLESVPVFKHGSHAERAFNRTTFVNTCVHLLLRRDCYISRVPSYILHL